MRGATGAISALEDLAQISIHTPHAGSDNFFLPFGVLVFEFQSTLPMRGATITWTGWLRTVKNFNPHSPCGERLGKSFLDEAEYLFQSTLPMRGATAYQSHKKQPGHISIHTPHAGSDTGPLCGCPLVSEFQSTLPMRGATALLISRSSATTFQSTLPMRGATISHTCKDVNNFRFQSTLPMRGATRPARAALCRQCYFNPHSPCGERLKHRHKVTPVIIISIHTPHAGSDEIRL